jgi:hypothetical protein
MKSSPHVLIPAPPSSITHTLTLTPALLLQQLKEQRHRLLLLVEVVADLQSIDDLVEH